MVSPFSLACWNQLGALEGEDPDSGWGSGLWPRDVRNKGQWELCPPQKTEAQEPWRGVMAESRGSDWRPAEQEGNTAIRPGGGQRGGPGPSPAGAPLVWSRKLRQKAHGTLVRGPPAPDGNRKLAESRFAPPVPGTPVPPSPPKSQGSAPAGRVSLPLGAPLPSLTPGGCALGQAAARGIPPSPLVGPTAPSAGPRQDGSGMASRSHPGGGPHI